MTASAISCIDNIGDVFGGSAKGIALSLRFANDDLVSLCRRMDIITRNDANFYSSAERLRCCCELRNSYQMSHHYDATAINLLRAFSLIITASNETHCFKIRCNIRHIPRVCRCQYFYHYHYYLSRNQQKHLSLAIVILVDVTSVVVTSVIIPVMTILMGVIMI